MQILIVTFNLDGVSDAEYRRSCEAGAAIFADVPGLTSKTWLADERTNTYGGVYSFADREALAAYTDSELYRSIGADPSVTNFSAAQFDVLDAPTRVTRGMPAVAA